MAQPDSVMDEKERRLRYLYQMAEAAGDTEVMDQIRAKMFNVVRDRQVRSEVSKPRAALIGAANSVIDLGEGAAMLYGNLGLDENSNIGDAAAQHRQARQQRMEPLESARPKAFGAGEMAPSMAIPGGGASTLIPRLGGAALAAGGEEYVRSGGNTSQAIEAALYGAAGNEAGRLAARATFGGPLSEDEITDLKIRPNPTETVGKANVRRAEEQGIILTPAAKSNNPWLAQIEASQSRNPMMSGPYLKIQAKNQASYNRIARKSLGLPPTSEPIDEFTIDELHIDLGQKFERLVGGNESFYVSPEFFDQMQDLRERARKGITRDPKAIEKIDNVIEKVANLDNGKLRPITVSDYQQTSSDLARLARKTDDPEMERVLYGIREALDYSFEKAYPSTGKTKELREVRDKWRRLREIEESKSLDGGNFRPTVMYNYIRNKHGRVNPNAGPIENLATSAHTFRDRIPNSGTPTGASIQDFMQAPLGSKALMLGGNSISNAYLQSGGFLAPGPRIFGKSTNPAATFWLPTTADILAPRTGRVVGMDQAEEGPF